MDEKLKKCPFCGGEAKIDKWDSERWIAECKICHIHTNPYSKAELAISAWNRRVEG